MKELKKTDTKLVTGSGRNTTDLHAAALNIIKSSTGTTSSHIDMGGMFPLASLDDIYDSGQIQNRER